MASDARTVTIKDHDDDEVVMAWVPKRKDKHPEDLPPFGFPVYLTSKVEHPATFKDAAALLASTTSHRVSMPERCHYRLDVYSRPQPNALACMTHARQELWHRNRNGIWPRLVPNWFSPANSVCGGFLILIDNACWPMGRLTTLEYHVASSSPGVQVRVMQDPDFENLCRFLTYRFDTWDAFGQTLKFAWHAAGHTWTQDDLQRRNNGGFSPALYPAVDPSAHFDVNFDNGLVEAEEGAPSADEEGAALQRWSRSLNGNSALEWCTYVDLSGCEVLSTWARSCAKARPERTMTVYFSHPNKEASFQSRVFANLLTCLVDLTGTPWCLDIVCNPHSLESAFSHYAREVSRRSVALTESRQYMTRWLLAKINAFRLPNEILEMIEALLVPPAIVPHLHRSSTTDIDRTIFVHIDGKTSKAHHLVVRFWRYFSRKQSLLDLTNMSQTSKQLADERPYDQRVRICDASDVDLIPALRRANVGQNPWMQPPHE